MVIWEGDKNQSLSTEEWDAFRSLLPTSMLTTTLEFKALRISCVCQKEFYACVYLSSVFWILPKFPSWILEFQSNAQGKVRGRGVEVDRNGGGEGAFFIGLW